MKKIILLAAFIVVGVISISLAQDVMTVKMKDGTVHEFKVEDVSEVTFQVPETPDEHLNCPDNNHPHMIDLGLPSGTKWACCNVGASKPEEYGGYYAWGETEEKARYDWSTYKYCSGSALSCSHIGDDIAGTLYDVAHVKWGGSWQMPSKEQNKELYENCTRTWVTHNGVKGILVTGQNGATIFMPASGHRWKDKLNSEGECGEYWSSTLDTQHEYGVTCLLFSSSTWLWWEEYVRAEGMLVRAVSNQEDETHVELDCPDEHHPHLIDLGLPSGTKWACCNVGASEPKGNGGYYAWGETEEKDYYGANTYIYGDPEEDSSYIGTDIAGTRYDVAYVKWGHEYEMATIEQFREVKEHCSLKWVTVDGKNGCLVTGPNGNSIFLPAAGSLSWDENTQENKEGSYWSSSLYSSNKSAYGLYCGSYGWDLESTFRAYGRSVRAVGFTESHKEINPEDHIAEAVDLGLPSGTKWASWNIGATKPEEYGGYYAWGETEEKDYYDWSSYIHCDGSYSTCHHIGDDIAGTEYDVAHVKWGGSWRMPSIDQFKELIDKCSRIWTSQNGVNGILVTGPNGNTIFLPAAGDHAGDNLSWVGSYGCYWSSSNYRIEYGYAYSQCFDSSIWFMDSSWFQRYFGQSVRAVISP